MRTAWGRWPYQKILDKLNRDINRISSEWEIWPRNSFLTTAFRPLKSDLDLTLWMKSPPSAGQRDQLRRTLRRTKMFFPFLGECNVYVESFAFQFSSFFNRYERSRDPRAQERLMRNPLDNKDGDFQAQRSAFLLRMLWSDRKNLRKAPQERFPKWKHHLQSLDDSRYANAFNPEKPFESLLTASLSWFLETHEPLWIHQRVKEIRPYLLKESETAHPPVPVSLVALYPHLFYFENTGSFKIFQDLRKITLAQLEWEIWGLQSQFLLISERRPYNKHVKNLIFFCEENGRQTGDLRFHELAEGFKSFRALTDLIP